MDGQAHAWRCCSSAHAALGIAAHVHCLCLGFLNATHAESILLIMDYSYMWGAVPLLLSNPQAVCTFELVHGSFSIAV